MPSSSENGKNPAQSRSAATRNSEQHLVVALGLAREPDDERRAERGRRAARRGSCRSRRGTGRRSPIASCGAAAPATRAASERSKYGTTVSSSSIVDTSGSCTSDGYRYSSRMRVSPEARQRVEPAQQRRERAGLAGVAAVPREVLRDEHELGSRLARRARALRPRSTPASASAACRGTTGSHRTRRRGRTPRRSSRTPTARDGAGRGSSRRSRTPVGLRLQHDARRGRPRPRSRRPRPPRAARPRARRRSARPCNR